MKFYRDKTGDLKKVFEKVRPKYFNNTLLEYAKINYIYREGEKTLPDGRVVRGEARKLSPKDRDIYGYDFEISVCQDFWVSCGSIEKIILARHELDHCIVIPEDPDVSKPEPKRDKEGRIVIKIKPHDLNMNIFMEDVELFGLPSSELRIVKDVYMIAKDRRSLSKNRRKVKKAPAKSKIGNKKIKKAVKSLKIKIKK